MSGQPLFALLLISGDDLLRDPVDVGEQCRGDLLQHGEPQLFGHVDLLQLREDQLAHATLAQPVSTNQGIDRAAVLGKSAGMLYCGGGSLGMLHRDPAAQRLQNGRDVTFGSGVEQFGQGVVTQLLDLAAHQICDG